jgi:transmembrane sensor
MSHSKEHIDYEELATKWIDKSISPEEEQVFNTWYEEGQDEPLYIRPDFARSAEIHKERIYQQVMDGLAADNTPIRKLWWPVPLAAVVLILICSAAYFYLQSPKQYDLDKLASRYRRGSSVAVWIDEHQKQVLLKDSVFNVVGESGALKSTGRSANKIVTPKGAHYKILLADGTKVWLGAASSLIYPKAFNGLKRTVQLSGAAYFEVAHNPNQPFNVVVVTKSNQQNIEVIGTKFNVSGYDDDKEIRTQVLDGVVKVTANGKTTILTKGEQLSSRKGQLSAKELMPEIAFPGITRLEFYNEDIEDVMRKIGREYNFEIEFAYSGSRDVKLSGQLNPKQNSGGVQKVLNLLEAVIDFHFVLEDRKIVVYASDNEAD